MGLAGRFSGVYPRASPGGWQLLGRTGVALWDLRRAEPALLAPGMRVQFVDAGPEALAARESARPRRGRPPPPVASAAASRCSPPAR